MTRAADKAPLRIRENVPADARAIESLYPLAFPDEDLLPLVRKLLRDSMNTLSLVAVSGSEIAGNVIFTHCTLDDGKVRAALLAPLAVLPDHQRQGTGSALVRAGLERLREDGIQAVYVLGDPAYYRRLGFSPERAVSTPCPMPPEWSDAWQSQRLVEAAAPLSGPLQVADAWLDPVLWLP